MFNKKYLHVHWQCALFYGCVIQVFDFSFWTFKGNWVEQIVFINADNVWTWGTYRFGNAYILL